MKALLKTLSWLFLLLLLLLLVAVFMLTTSAGNQALLGLANKYVNALEITGGNGILLNDFTADKLRWQGEREQVTASKLVFKNNSAALLKKAVHVEALTIDHLKIALQPREDKPKESPQSIQLPIALQADEIAIGQLEIIQTDQAGNQRSQIIDNIYLSAKAENEYVSIQQFRAQPILDGEPLSVDLQGEVNINEPYTLDAQLLLDYAHAEQGKAKGDFTLSGDTQNYRLDGTANWDSPRLGALDLTVKGEGTRQYFAIENLDLNALQGKATAKGKVEWQDGIRWGLDITTDKIRTDQLAADFPGIITTRLSSQGVRKDGVLQADVDLTRLQGELKAYPLDAKGTVTVRGDAEQTAIDIADLALKAFGGDTDLTGKLLIKGKDLEWDASLTTRNLQADNISPDLPATINATLTTQGQQRNGELQADIDLERLDGNYKDYPLTANGVIRLEGNPAADLVIETKPLAVTALGGDSRLQGTVTVAGKAISWDATLSTDGLQTEKVLPEWPASITTTIESKGRLQDGRPELTAKILKLDGKLLDNPLKGTGLVQVAGDTITVDDVDVQSGSNRLKVNGQASAPFDLTWSLEGNNLSQLLKGLQGKLSADGRLKGRLDTLQVQADVAGKNVRYQDYALKTVDLTVSQKNKRFELEGALAGLQVADQLIKAADIKGSGTIEQHRVVLDVEHELGVLALTASGGLKNQRWQGQVSDLILDKTQVGRWQLAKSVNVTASAKQADVSRLCLQNGDSSLCAKGEWQQEKNATSIKADGELTAIPFRLVKSYLPNTVDLPGSLDADFDFRQQGKVQSGSVRLVLPDNQLTIKPEQGDAQTLRYQNAQLNASLQNNRVQSDFTIKLLDRGDIDGNATINLKSKGKHQLDGQINLDMPSIRWVDALVPAINQLNGAVKGNVRLSGLLTQPQIQGAVKLVDAGFSLPETGTSISAANLTVQANNTRQATIRGSLQSGEGTLNINGQASLGEAQQWQARVTLQGDNLDFMNTHEIQGKVSPNLTIQANPKQVRVDGTLTVPETRVTLNELPPTAIQASDDVVIVGRSAQAQVVKKQTQKSSSAINIHPNVSIVLGDKVDFSGFGLSTRLTGQLRITKPKQTMITQGSLNTVDGIFKAYGQELLIDRGRLVFNGPLDNPGLDIQAIREKESEDIKVGMQLRGTVKKPETSLFSTPSMSQTDILSYLLTGRSFSEASGNESSMLLGAITSLGVAGGEGLARKIGGNLGLDSVNLTTGEDGQLDSSELELGKKLGPKLYLKYIVGVFDSMQKVAIEYQINKRLKLEAESGLHQGLDLIYQVERD